MKNQSNPRRRHADRPAFTLLEMMLVVVIMGVLATVAVVSLGGRGDAAKRGATFASLNTVKSSIDTYHLEKNRYPTSVTELVPKYLAKVPKDGWKREFVYVSPSADGKPYDCFSMGADGQIGGGDDVSVWDEELPEN